VRDHIGDDKATGSECELLHVLLLRNCPMSDASNLPIYYYKIRIMSIAKWPELHLSPPDL
jgi:hypothetical protein